MARVPSRKALEDMKRTDIQKLCKDYGVRANLKTDALIDLLIDASKPTTTKAAPTPRSRTVSSATKASSRRTSGRSRGPSKSSVIVHESDSDEEEEEGEEEETEEEDAVAPEPDTADEADNEDPAPSDAEPTPPPTPPPTTRNRKAKDMQTRLGVGRPVIAGGTGARAVTKSISVPKGSKRGNISRSIPPVQETIMEEELETSPTAPSPPAVQSQPEASWSSHAPTPTPQNPLSTTEGSLASLEAIDKRVADALRPLHEQMSSLKSEVERLRTQVSEVPKLQLKVQNLTSELEVLRSGNATKTASLEGEMGRLKEEWARKAQMQVQLQAPVQGSSTGSGTPSRLTPGKYGSLGKSTGWSGPSVIAAAKTNSSGKATGANSSGSETAHAGNIAPGHPGFAAAITGKRRRDSDASNITGVIEEDQQDEFTETELERRVIRPTKKRAKLDNDGSSQDEDQGSGSLQPQYSQNEDQHDVDQTQAPRPPSFTVFSGPDDPDNFANYIDPPPPTNHLPDFFAPSSEHGNTGDNNEGGSGTQTSTANASENQNPFGFSFLPTSSTPMHPMYPMGVQGFPYPEAPTSPSPVGNERGFQPFGLSPSRPRSGANTSRPGSRQDGDGIGTVNPAALTGRHPEPSSHDLAAGLGLTSVPMRMGEGTTAAGPAKRTMYGTELEGDTRFGDFGVEGVASGFWAGGRY